MANQTYSMLRGYNIYAYSLQPKLLTNKYWEGNIIYILKMRFILYSLLYFLVWDNTSNILSISSQYTLPQLTSKWPYLQAVPPLFLVVKNHDGIIAWREGDLAIYASTRLTFTSQGPKQTLFPPNLKIKRMRVCIIQMRVLDNTNRVLDSVLRLTKSAYSYSYP